MRTTWTSLMGAGLLALAVPAGAYQPANQSPAYSSPPWIWSGGGGTENPAHVSYLGVDPQDVTADRMGELKLKEERGVEVMMVDQDGPASKAGIREHDVILQFDGRQVESVEQLRRLIREVPPGRTVAVGLSRDGQPLNLKVTLGDRNHAMARIFVMPNIPPIPAIPSIPPLENMDSWSFVVGDHVYGMQVEGLTPQLGEFFGVKNGDGVLVREVERGSPASAAGLKAGDVIIKVENQRITGRGDFRVALLHGRHGSGKVTLQVVRDRHEQPLVLTLPQRASRDTSALIFPGSDFEQGMRQLEQTMEARSKQVEDVQSKALADAERKLNHIKWQQITAHAMQKAKEALQKAAQALGNYD